MEVLEAGSAEYFKVDPDEHRAWVRDHKDRKLVSKLIDEHEAVSRFVADGDYVAWRRAVRGG